jgi:general secretion pathway protein D
MLVIHQSPAAHDEIGHLLSALERLYDLQVALDVRLVVMSAACFEGLGINLEPISRSNEDPNPSCMGKALLTDLQKRKLFEDAQGDRLTNIMQAPKMVVLDGQAGTVDVSSRQTFLTALKRDSGGNEVICTPKQEAIKLGVCMTVLPRVAADRKSVYVNLQLKQTQLVGPASIIGVQFPMMPLNKGGKEEVEPKLTTMLIQQPQVHTLTIDNTTVIPEGQTLLLASIRTLTTEERNESTVPILNKIPFLNRFVRNLGYGREPTSLLIMLTPRIIVENKQIPSDRQNRNGP